MKNVNAITVTGRLGQDPRVKELQNGNTITTFSIANNKSYKKNGEWHQKATWINIVVWGEISNRIQKGSAVLVQGSLEGYEYSTTDDVKRGLQIIANSVAVIENGFNTDKYEKQENYGMSAEPKKSDISPDDYDDDLPF